MKPADLLHLPGAEAELDRLLAELPSDKVAIRRVAESVRKHESFATFVHTVLPNSEETIATLANLLKRSPAWSTGFAGEWSAEQVAEWVTALGDASAQALPVASLVKALHSQKELRKLLPGFLQSTGGRLGETAYTEVLTHLATKHQQSDQEERKGIESVLARGLREIDSGRQKPRSPGASQPWGSTVERSWRLESARRTSPADCRTERTLHLG